MIATLVALLVAAASPSTAPTAPPDVPPLRDLVTPAQVLTRYAAALAALVPPRVLTFEYVVEQTGARDLLQTHRIFRSGTTQRDEILEVDGRKLDAPSIRIIHGRTDRYAVTKLAPRVDAYAFRFVGKSRDAHHFDYTFVTQPHVPSAFRVTRVTIDGASYLPTAIAFATDAHHGTGSISYVRAEKYWVPAVAVAHGTYAKLAAREKISFMSYRFPPSLPPGTFAQPRPAAALKPDS